MREREREERERVGCVSLCFTERLLFFYNRFLSRERESCFLSLC